MLCSQIFLFVATLGVSARVVERQDDGRNHILNYDCVGDQSKGDMPEICNNMCYGIMDGNEYNKDGLVPGNTALKRDTTSMTRAYRNYMTKDGRNIYVPDGANVGDIVWTPKSYDEDLEFDVDEIIGSANATMV